MKRSSLTYTGRDGVIVGGKPDRIRSRLPADLTVGSTKATEGLRLDWSTVESKGHFFYLFETCEIKAWLECWINAT